MKSITLSPLIISSVMSRASCGRAKSAMKDITMADRKTGGCLCKSVHFEVDGTLNAIVACHCSQCAKTSGNFATMTSTAAANVTMLSDETLRWFPSSENVTRGFCSRCGSNLFWKQTGSADIYITAGTIDKPVGVKIGEHIYVASKSDYYEITDGLPQKSEW